MSLEIHRVLILTLEQSKIVQAVLIYTLPEVQGASSEDYIAYYRSTKISEAEII